MKDDIQKRLREEARTHTPDVFDEVVTSAERDGLLRTAAEPQKAKNRTRLYMRILMPTATAAACAAIFVPIWLLNRPIDHPIPHPNITAMSATDAYGIGAVSAAKLLNAALDSSEFPARSVYRARALDASTDGETDVTDVTDRMSAFDRYFTALDSFFGDDIVTTRSEINNDSAYPYYAKLTVTGLDFDGNTVEYVMYYNETFESDSALRPDRYARQERRKADKKKYTLNGVMLLDGAEYLLEGEREAESDDDETENELLIRAYADPDDKTTYVQMEQEISVESDEHEVEFIYTTVMNGKTVEQTSVEFEKKTDDDSAKTEFTLEFLQGDAKGKYSVKRKTENGKTTTKVKYEFDGESGELRIEIKDGKYEYKADKK